MCNNTKQQMEITKNQNEAVNDIVEMVVNIIGNGSRQIDTTEAISSTARLAGSFLFRSFGFEIVDAKPGTVMLS
jgi:ABC-type xylose transport system substrate-binding protein